MDRLPSVNNYSFAQVPQANIPRSTFKRDMRHATTFDAGYLIPIYVDEVLPGDTFNVSMTGFGRLATPIHPVMDNMYLDTFFFFVPNRLLWDNWAKFNGEQTNPGDSTDYSVPQVTTPASVGFGEDSLFAYMGIRPGVVLNQDVNALHSRAYNLIYNEWFRDENLIDSAVVDTDDGPDTASDYVLRRRGKRHDYFTSCLPSPQKSDAGAVTLPLGTKAEIHVAGTTGAATDVYADGAAAYRRIEADASYNARVSANSGSSAQVMYADLSTATASTINAIREAFQIQKLYERDARGGTRETEIIRSHFGVVSPDARLQRPEYLGGGSSPININPVAQTSSTDVTTPQGNLSAFGTVGLRGHGFTKSFTEHGVIIGLVCARADLTYTQGVHKMWHRQDRFDYYWPALAHLGEQAVLNQEIYAQGTSADADVFGYQERFAEYRYGHSLMTGAFRPDHSASLDSWHLSQEFTSLPVLNQTFIEETPPVDRVIAVSSEPHFIFDSIFNVNCARPMPTYSVPGMIDRF